VKDWPAESAPPPARPLTPNQMADLLALRESDDWAPERGVTLVEGPRPWGNRYAGPVADWVDNGRPVGLGVPQGRPAGRDAPRQGRRIAGPEDLARQNAGRERRPRPLDGTAWIGAPADPSAPCPVCGDSIRPGSRRYCDRCGDTGYRSQLLAQACAAFGREIDLRDRGLYVDCDGLVQPLPGTETVAA
jgi:hypothetical protein